MSNTPEQDHVTPPSAKPRSYRGVVLAAAIFVGGVLTGGAALTGVAAYAWGVSGPGRVG